jgi:HEPN domain-containing protein
VGVLSGPASGREGPQGLPLLECQALDPSFAALAEVGRLLDQHYISTRYPNGLDEETPPARYYEKGDAETCLRSARSILERVKPSFTS